MRRLVSAAVSYPVTVLMAVLAVLLLGYLSFRRLGVDLFPAYTNPRIYVEVKAGERPPEEMEKLFVDGIEALAIRQRGVVDVSSICRVGVAQVTVEYAWNTDMDEAFLDLQKTLSPYAQNPDIEELTISQHDPNAEPILVLALWHPEIEDLDELRKVAENTLRNELIRLEGIAEVRLSGQEEKEVAIETDPYLLEAYGLSLDALSSRIQALNREVSGGSVVEFGLRYVIRGVGSFRTLEDFGSAIVGYRQETDLAGNATGVRTPIYLKDVARISYRTKDPYNLVHLNGRRCVGLSVYKETRFNTVEAVRAVLEKLEELRRALPGYRIEVVRDQGEFIRQAVGEVKQTAAVGIVLAVMVLYVFLRRIGSTLVVSLAIPISIIATFNMMYFNGLTLNLMTLGGLALGAGMLVDNAIVVVENISRLLERGRPLREAVVEGAAQVGGAITASTLTTVVVFLPIVYLHGFSAQLFRDEAWTVAFSLLASLAVAMLVIPVLSARFLQPRTTAPIRSFRFSWYRGVLAQILRRKGQVIAASILLVVLTVLILPHVGKEFVPRADLREFSIRLRLPEGTELARTEATVSDVETLIGQVLGDGVELVYSHIGPSEDISASETAVFEDENTATVYVRLKKQGGIRTEEAIARLGKVLSEVPDLQAEFVQEQVALRLALGTEEAPLAVEIRGEDLDELEKLTEEARTRLASVPDLFNLETSFEKGRPEVNVVVDRLRAGLYNLGVSQVASQLRDILQGRVVDQWEAGGELRDITLRLPKVPLSQLEDIYLTQGSEKVRLDEVARIEMGYAPREIHRRNQTRIGKISAHVRSGRPFDHVVKEVERRLADLPLPPDYRLAVTGEEEKRQDAFRSLSFALVLSVVLVYMVLASQFESLVHPFTILLTIPLALVGSVWLFYLLGRPLNIIAYIGMIVLAGIAVNDSIILVDAINQLRREGMSRQEAILEAGARRIRPILMTSLTTILALLPLSFGLGEGATLRSPLALAVIGGLTSSTLLTLVVIPCVYDVLDHLRPRRARES
ncbi:MAG: efflux RND transporter permease subunit [candidate division KSB1 bacterium]|nr:efflux RND transporter permease subunit [candidate division KSB1 bacterium]